MIPWLLVAGLCGVFGWMIGKAFNRAGMGIALGALFGPLGLLVVVVVGLCDASNEARYSPRRRSPSAPVRVPCPMCKEMIIKGAAICPHCRSELTWPEVKRQVVRSGGRVVKRRIVIKRG